MLNSKIIYSLFAIGSFSIFSLSSCHPETSQPAQKELKRAIVNMSATNSSGLSGNVLFEETADGMIMMTANIEGISPGAHAIHIHETGDCSAPDGTSAGGHWNPTNEDHGVWGGAHFHRGDIGNIVADSSNKGTITRTTDLWCIDCGDATKNVIGKAIIIHQGPDDFSSQPSGAAGPRIGCGVIELQ